jgi:hypothetical protein
LPDSSGATLSQTESVMPNRSRSTKPNPPPGRHLHHGSITNCQQALVSCP